MINTDKLPEDLEKALLVVSKSSTEVETIKGLRELLRTGYVKILFGKGWLLTDKGMSYLQNSELE